MPTYTYRCAECLSETSDEYPIGTARRVKKCACGRPARRVIGEDVYISAAATPTSRGTVISIDRREKQFDKDGTAYKRMRHRGLQPNQIDGCARLEDRVGDQNDIDYARAIAVAEQSGGGKERVVETVESLEVTHG